MALPNQKVTTTESLGGSVGPRCDLCNKVFKVGRRSLEGKWVCEECDPSVNEFIRVVEDDEEEKR